MTVPASTPSKVTANGNGTATVFSFSPMVISQSSELTVTKRTTAGVETLLTEGSGSTNYSVAVSPYPGTGSITYPASGGTPLATGEKVIMKPVRALSQLNTLENLGGYFPDTQETMFDKLTYAALQHQEEIDRCVKITIGDATTVLATLTANINTLGAISANITTVAGISGNVTTVAGISGNVTTVAGISGNVTTVAGISGDVTTVVGMSANITTVAGISANVTTVAGISANVTTVAGISGNVTTVAGISANVTTVAGISANVTTVAGISANVTTVAGISGSITTVAADAAQVAADKISAAASAAAAQAAAASGTTYVLTTGSANAYVITPTVPLGAYANGNHYFIKASFANTGTATGNISALGAKTIKKFSGAGIAVLEAGDIEANGSYELIYDSVADALILLYGGSAAAGTSAINSLDIFNIYAERLADEVQNIEVTTDGFADTFTDGTTQNNTTVDLTASTGETNDNTGKTFINTVGGTNLNADQDYTTEANYETYDYPGTTATIATNTITITAGTFPSNAVGMRFSPENPFNPANSAAVETYTDSTHIVLVSGHGLTASNSAWTLRSFQIASGVVKLSVAGSSGVFEQETGTPTSDKSFYGGTANSESKSGFQFKATTVGAITALSVALKKIGSPSDNITATIYTSTTPTTTGGNPSASVAVSTNTVSGSTLTTAYADYTFNFSDYVPTLNNYYWIIFSRSGANDTTNAYKWGGSITGYAHSAGNRYLDAANNWGSDGTGSAKFALTQDSSVNVINEYVPVIPTYANLADVSSWSDVNSFAKTETLNSADVWYLVFANAQSGFGANTQLGVHEVTTGTYRLVVKNEAGTWKFNSNATYGSETLTAAAINSIAGAIREAMTVAANKMTSAVLIQSMDASLSVPTGKAGIVPVLYSTVNTNNPQVDQTRVNYDAQASLMTLVSRAFGGTNMPPAPTAAPATLYAYAIYKVVSGAVTFSVSRDGGTTWTAISSWTLQDTLADGATKRSYASTGVTGQPSGTSPMLKCVQSAAGQSVIIYSWGLQYK